MGLPVLRKMIQVVLYLKVFRHFSQAFPFNYFQYRSQFNSIKLSNYRISLLNTEFTEMSKDAVKHLYGKI